MLEQGLKDSRRVPKRRNKAAAFVSYGSLGGARAIEHLRTIASELKPATQHEAAAGVLFDQLQSWAGTLKTVRV